MCTKHKAYGLISRDMVIRSIAAVQISLIQNTLISSNYKVIVSCLSFNTHLHMTLGVLSSDMLIRNIAAEHNYINILSNIEFDANFIIQIKICAEYRDMLPRPRLVCQEPGLRPIGRSPGVPDKSSRGS